MSSETPTERLDVNGMVAVVTGGAGGIGKGIVTALLGRGATVVIADIEADTTEATVAELSDLGPVSGWPTDVADEGSVAALADHCPSLLGHGLKEDLTDLEDGYVFNLNGLTFLGEGDFTLADGDALLLLSSQAGG